MTATAWFAFCCWVPLVVWVIVERYERKESDGYAKFWQEAAERSDAWRYAKVAELRVLQKKYDTLAAEQNGTKRRAIKAERIAAPRSE